MPVVRVKSDGKPKRNAYTMAVLGSVGVMASLVLYVSGFYNSAVYVGVISGALCSVYSVLDGA